LDRGNGRGVFGLGDFRRLWAAGLAVTIARWLEMLVIGVVVWRETESALLVSAMTLLRMLPMGLFGAFVGVVADRVQRRDALVAVLALQAVAAGALALLAATGHVQIWHIAVASFLNGLSWAADNPVRRMMMGEIVGSARMGQAMSLEVIGNNASRVLGPAAGGILLAWQGLAAPFLLAALLYCAAILATLGMAHRSTILPPRAGSVLRQTMESFGVVLRAPGMAGIMAVTVVFNIFAWPCTSMVPVIAQQRLGLGAGGTGLLAAMDGLGALAGAAMILWLARSRNYPRLYVGGTALYLAMLVAFAASPAALPAGGALLLMGVGSACFAITQGTLVYVAAPGELRSRALGVLSFCIGLGLLGFLHIGIMSSLLGASTATMVVGAEGLLALLLARRLWPRLG
jgi:MFS family permease